MIDYTLLLILVAVTVLAVVTSTLGVFVFLGGQSLLSDVVAHASLPGIVAAFLLMNSGHPLVLLAGAVVSSALALAFMVLLEQTTILKKDTILGIILSTFFGFGLVLMTVAQRTPGAHKIQFHKILFGMLATVIPADIVMLAVMATVVLAVLFFFWKEFVLVIFDAVFAVSIGYPVRAVRSIFMGLILITVITGLQTVGIMLMSSMLVAPAAAAYQWCSRFNMLALLALLLGVSSGIIGALVSCSLHTPTGPTIIIILNIIVLFSVLFGSQRGLVSHWLYANKWVAS